jgi:hypothetical protein
MVGPTRLPQDQREHLQYVRELSELHFLRTISIVHTGSEVSEWLIALCR